MSADLDAKTVTLALLDYCRENDWAGYDPYDALNSRVYLALPFLHSRWPRVILTQALKRSPVNIRPLAGVPKTQNPKALGLFAETLLKLSRLGWVDEAEVHAMGQRILASRSPDQSYSAWGYSFPWQTRTIVVPRNAPNLVCTTFVANSLMSLFEASGEQTYLDAAISAANYIVEKLFWTEGDIASFSYPRAGEKSRIHNANLLAAALLCRVSKHHSNSTHQEVAFKAVRYAISCQRDDGSWMYGELPTQQWIDNFHTGYNLCALRDISHFTGANEFVEHLKRGYRFYLDHFIRDDGAAKYFHDRVYPIDVHCVAQTILTLLALGDLDASSRATVDRVYKWAINNLWDSKGYFYYRVLPFCTIKTSYMRWSQAWMLLALATLAEAGSEITAEQAPEKSQESMIKA